MLRNFFIVCVVSVIRFICWQRYVKVRELSPRCQVFFGVCQANNCFFSVLAVSVLRKRHRPPAVCAAMWGVCAGWLLQSERGERGARIRKIGEKWRRPLAGRASPCYLCSVIKEQTRRYYSPWSDTRATQNHRTMIKKEQNETVKELLYTIKRYRDMGNGPMCQRLINQLRRVRTVR